MLKCIHNLDWVLSLCSRLSWECSEESFVGACLNSLALYLFWERIFTVTSCWILCQDEFQNMVTTDGQSVIKNVAFESEKLRLFRCATINGGDKMQVFYEYFTL